MEELIQEVELGLVLKHSKVDRCVHDNYIVDTPSALLIISNTNFSFNSAKERGGAIYISHYQGDRYFCQVKIVKIWFKDCTFVNNFGNGAAMETKQH